MTVFLDILNYPFMQRAIVAGALLGVLLASLGVIATLRKMAFFGDGVAHASLAGIAIGVLAGTAPLPFALLWAVFIAIVIYVLERSTRLSSDTLIGILFTASMALGVILMNYTTGYQPELISFLFGSILAVRPTDLWIMAGFTVLISTWFFASLRHLTYSALSEEAAMVAGIPVKRQTLAFYIALAIATVLGVKILGIVLVSALLVLPAATAKLITRSFKSYVAVSIIIAEVVILTGLILSFALDLPSGAVVVLVGTTLFFLVSLFSRK